MYIYISVCIYIYMYVCTHTYIYIHTCMCTFIHVCHDSRWHDSLVCVTWRSGMTQLCVWHDMFVCADMNHWLACDVTWSCVWRDTSIDVWHRHDSRWHDSLSARRDVFVWVRVCWHGASMCVTRHVLCDRTLSCVWHDVVLRDVTHTYAHAVWCFVLHCIAVCGSVLQCVAVCCSALQCDMTQSYET